MTAMSTVHERPTGVTPDTAFFRTLPAGGPIEDLHVHEYDTSICVLEGVIYLISEDDERPMTPGDQARIPAGDPHRIFNAGDSDAQVLEGLKPDECAYC
jgi:quercetin dioxygenase-like cupin family protein